MKTLVRDIHFIFVLPLAVYKNGVVGSLLVAFVTASIVTSLWNFVNTYIYDDWIFLKYFAVAISVDLASGIVKNWLTKSICWEDGLIKFARKLFVCIAILVMFHVFVNFDKDGATAVFAKEYLDMIKRLMILSFIGLSAITNIYEISGGKFPPLWLISRLRDYDDKGDKIIERETKVKEQVTETTISKKVG
jgi:hypothetical protein